MAKKIEKVLETGVRDFPSDIEERASAILSCINTEPKQILLSFCLDDETKTGCELRRIFCGYVDAGSHWVPGTWSFEGYSRQTFVPIGMVAEELIKYEGRGEPVIAWRMTEAGKRYGRQMAAFGMKYAVEHGISMFQILGQTGSSGDSRSPYNRFRILTTLRKKGVLREIDLCKDVGVHKSAMLRHLEEIKSLGFVAYDSATVEEPGFSVYKWVKGKPKDVITVLKERRYTKEISNLIYSIKEISTYDLSDKTKISINNVSNVVSGLVKQGFIKPVKFRSRYVLSEVCLLESGREFVEVFCEPFYYALHHDDFIHIQNAVRVFDDFDRAAEYAGKAMDLYGKVSPHKHHRDIEQTQRAIVDFVRIYQERNNGVGPRSKEILEKFRLSTSTAYFGPLVGHELVKERQGRATRYQINPNYSSQLA